MQLSANILQLPLAQPFKLSYGTFPMRKALILSLSDGDYTGYGEATEISYYNWKVDEFMQELEDQRNCIENLTLDDPRNLQDFIQEIFPRSTAMQSALDCAFWDLYTQNQGQTVHEFLNLNIDKTPISSFTISQHSPREMLNSIYKNQWPILKLKLGGKKDMEVLRLLTELDSSKKLRIDANGGWNLSTTLKAISVAEEIGIELIEQPLPVDKEKDLNGLKEKTTIPIIADESFHTLEDVEKCAEFYDGINLKLMKCGGISPFLDIATQARKLDLNLMAGCMTETYIGISALCQVAPMVDYLDADGAELLATEPAIGVKVQLGKVNYPDKAGIGASLID